MHPEFQWEALWEQVLGTLMEVDDMEIDFRLIGSEYESWMELVQDLAQWQAFVEVWNPQFCYEIITHPQEMEATDILMGRHIHWIT
jgi:hypothetical protein